MLSLYLLTIFVIVSPGLTTYVVVTLLLLLLGGKGLGRGTGRGRGVDGLGVGRGISGTGSVFPGVLLAIITARGRRCRAITIVMVFMFIKFNLSLGDVETVGSWNIKLSS